MSRPNPKVAFVSTGDEVLSGLIEDTNASWISRYFLESGLKLKRRVTVADDLQELVNIFGELSINHDVVIVNGGLGPTEDDLSAQALGVALNESLELQQSWVDAMTEKFKTLNFEMSESNLKQAMLPKSATIIDNPVGTACGFYATINNARFYFTPGVPREFKVMVEDFIVDHIKQSFGIKQTFEVKRFFTYGFSESNLVNFLQPLQLPADITLGYRAAMPFIELKLTAEKSPLLENKALKMKELLGDQLLFEGNSNLAQTIQDLMVKQNKILGLAESCTGGMIANELVGQAGSSAYLDGGNVTYSNQAKVQMLGVDETLIERFGAVSPQVAKAMAVGVIKKGLDRGVNVALSVSGVAGPGASEAKPAGLVEFALAYINDEQKVAVTNAAVQFRFKSRGQVRKNAMVFALDLLRRHLQGLPLEANFEILDSNYSACITSL